MMGAKRCNWIPIVSFCPLSSLAGFRSLANALVSLQVVVIGRLRRTSAVVYFDGFAQCGRRDCIDRALAQLVSINGVDCDYSGS
jgi:hypothetical protein